MARLSKRSKAINEKIDRSKVYPLDEALRLLKEVSAVKFNESVDISVNLGVDPKKSDQVVRGATVLPNGTGKEVRVAVFTDGENDRNRRRKKRVRILLVWTILLMKLKKQYRL